MGNINCCETGKTVEKPMEDNEETQIQQQTPTQPNRPLPSSPFPPVASLQWSRSQQPTSSRCIPPETSSLQALSNMLEESKDLNSKGSADDERHIESAREQGSTVTLPEPETPTERAKSRPARVVAYF